MGNKLSRNRQTRMSREALNVYRGQIYQPAYVTSLPTKRRIVCERYPMGRPHSASVAESSTETTVEPTADREVLPKKSDPTTWDENVFYMFEVGKTTVTIKMGKLIEEEVDAIVNPLSISLMTTDPVLVAAGPLVLHILFKDLPKLMSSGQPVATGGGRLQIKSIFHARCSEWKDGANIRSLMFNSFRMAHARGYKSIGFPAIGTGRFGYPADAVVRLMMYEVFKFDKDYVSTTLNDIRVILDPNDLQSFKMITEELDRMLSDADEIENDTNVGNNHDDKCASDGNNNTAVSATNSMPSSVECNSVIPRHWDSVDSDEPCTLINLDPDSDEYKSVAERCLLRGIVAIKRVQNTMLYEHYAFVSKLMEKKNPGIKNEMILYHGTSEDCISNINNNGFNRSYSGKNGARFGQGVYFSINPIFSGNDPFCAPDAQGNRYLYQARVLVGKAWEGVDSCLKEPPYIPGSTSRYDSVTNFDKDMFVVYQDSKAYPEYLIVFRSGVPSRKRSTSCRSELC